MDIKNANELLAAQSLNSGPVSPVDFGQEQYLLRKLAALVPEAVSHIELLQDALLEACRIGRVALDDVQKYMYSTGAEDVSVVDEYRVSDRRRELTALNRLAWEGVECTHSPGEWQKCAKCMNMV